VHDAAVPGVEAVLFDWGGTLSVFADLDMVDMWRLAAHRLCPEREEELCQRLVAVEAETWERVGVDQRSTTLSSILASASAELGLDVTEAVLEEAASRHLDSWTPHIRHDPDAAGVLAALRRRGLRICLLSNTHWPRAFHEHFLERDRLVDLIDVRLYTSEMPRTKPHPSVFEAALEAVGVQRPGAAVFVGDRAYDDVFGAKALGLRTVLRRNPAVPGFPVVPDAVIDRLPELLPLVDAWVAPESN
jgi:putative hydrolase of the HAD superfamily